MNQPCSKTDWRSRLLQQRKDLAPDVWRWNSDRLCNHLITSPWFQKAETILSYWPVRQEPDLTPLLLDYPKRWGLPRCVGNELDWHSWQPGDRFIKGRYGLQEPDATAPTLAAHEVDLILVPAVGCDRAGYRIGYGGGYYDRLLSQPEWCNIPTLGITFEFAIIEQFPHDEWDQSLSGVCTEAGFFAA